MPVPPVKRINPIKQKAFLTAYRACGTICGAARASSQARHNHYRWLDLDDEYRKEFAQAQQEAADIFIAEAARRAKDGVAKLKFHQGKPIMIPALSEDGEPLFEEDGTPQLVPYVEYEYSDTMLMFLIKAMRPGEFRDRQDTSLTLKDQGQHTGVLVVQPLASSASEWEQQATTQQTELQNKALNQ